MGDTLITPGSVSQHQFQAHSLPSAGVDHPCHAHSTFANLVAPLAGSQHPHPAHGTHPTLQHPSLTHGTHARLSEPSPGLHHPCQAHSTHILLTAPLAGSQYSHYALYCPGQSHSTHPSLTAAIPRPQHPSHTHSTHDRLTGPVPGVYHLYRSARAMLVAPMAASQHPHRSHDTYTSPTTPTQVPQPHTSPLALLHSCGTPGIPLPPQGDCIQKGSSPSAIPPTIHANCTGVTAGALHPHPLCWAGSPFLPFWASARWPQLVQGCHELGELSLPLPWSKGPVIARGCRARRRQGHHRESKGPQGHGDEGPIKLIQPWCWNFPPRSQRELGGASAPMVLGSLCGGEGPGVPRWGVSGCWSRRGRW